MTTEPTTPTQHGGKRTGAGRPSTPDHEHMVYMQITLSRMLRDFAKAQPGGASAYIRDLIYADRQARKVK